MGPFCILVKAITISYYSLNLKNYFFIRNGHLFIFHDTPDCVDAYDQTKTGATGFTPWLLAYYSKNNT